MNSELQNIKDDGFEEGKKVNRPQLTEGMTRIMFDSNGKTILDGQSGWAENNWYSYGTEDNNKKWANTQTEDGSMWVWIPRFAYKITYTNPTNKSQGGSIDIKFLIGTTDNYYDGDQIKTAQRQKTPKSTKEYVKVEISYTTSPLSEYLGSHIYASIGLDVHETRLGEKDGKIVVACKDFIGNGEKNEILRIYRKFTKANTR